MVFVPISFLTFSNDTIQYHTVLYHTVPYRTTLYHITIALQGALLATTFFILFPESYNIVSGEFGGGGHGNHGREDRRILEEHGNEHSEGAATWRWGR